MNFIQYRIPSKLLEMTRNINIEESDKEMDTDEDDYMDEENDFKPLNIISNNLLNNLNNVDINDIYEKELNEIFSIVKPTIKSNNMNDKTQIIKKKKNIHKCKYCNKLYNSYNSLKKHLFIHKL